jgi:hypothetical protein
LEKAKAMFQEMDLLWDIDELSQLYYFVVLDLIPDWPIQYVVVIIVNSKPWILNISRMKKNGGKGINIYPTSISR